MISGFILGGNLGVLFQGLYFPAHVNFRCRTRNLCLSGPTLQKQDLGMEFPILQRTCSCPEYLENVPVPIKEGNKKRRVQVSEESSSLTDSSVWPCLT